MVEYCGDYGGISNSGEACSAPAGSGIPSKNTGRCKHHRALCILLLGYAGAGKTTLIQYFCGEGASPDKTVKSSAPGSKEFYFYSNDEVCFWEVNGMESGNTLEDYIQVAKDFLSREIRKPQFIWYCISKTGAQVTETDWEAIKKIKQLGFPLATVVTKNDIKSPRQEESIKYCLEEKVGEDPFFVSGKTGEGVRKLLDYSEKKPDKAVRAYKNYKSSDCFIATEIFCNPSHPLVCRYRIFREKILKRSSSGKLIVKLYEYLGPGFAKWVRNKKYVKQLFKKLLKIGANLLPEMN